ncbi:MAG: copper resistance protein [Frankiaceae bacterium]|nr:copper resistance protein [Frankiaceae bacterium]
MLACWRRRLAPALVVVTAAGLVATGADLAWAHAEVVSTYPSTTGAVHGRLTHVAVRFDDNVDLVPGSLTLATDLGVSVSLDRPRLVSGRELRAELQDEAGPGSYVAGWRIRADDGHIESGTFAFRIAGAAGAPVAAGPAPAPAPPDQPRWPVLVAIALALAAGCGAALVVQRGLRALRVTDVLPAATSGDDESRRTHAESKH